MKKTPPLTPQWHKFDLTRIDGELSVPAKMKREEARACPQGKYYNYLSAAGDLCFQIIVPFCPLPTQQGPAGTWLLKVLS